MNEHNDIERKNLAVIGRAKREHLENEVAILAAAQRVVGTPLTTHLMQAAALQKLADAADWQVGLAYVNLILGSEAELAVHGTVTIQ
jgi:hypothetical protein